MANVHPFGNSTSPSLTKVKERRKEYKLVQVEQNRFNTKSVQRKHERCSGLSSFCSSK